MDQKGAPDAEVAAIAERQHGVVSLGQLRGVGLSYQAVLGRERAGRLHRMHRGVYAVGHRAVGFRGRCMAASLAVEGAVVSHRSAARLWEMLPGTAGAIEVTIGSRAGRKRRVGVVVHRPLQFPPDVSTHRFGIPITTPARTLDDLRRTSSRTEWLRALRQAEVIGLSSVSDLTGDRTRSELERIFLRLCRRGGLPTPDVNVWIGGRIVDFLWPEQRLVVETDGYRYHRGRAAFEDDRERDLELRALGYEVVRLSYRQVTQKPSRVIEVLRQTVRAGRLSGRMHQ